MANRPEILEPVILSLGDESYARLGKYAMTISRSAEYLEKILIPAKIPNSFIRGDLEAKHQLYRGHFRGLMFALGALNTRLVEHDVFMRAMVEQKTNKVCGIELVTSTGLNEETTTGNLTSQGTIKLLGTMLGVYAERSIEAMQMDYVMKSIVRDRRSVRIEKVSGQTHVSGFAEMLQQRGICLD